MIKGEGLSKVKAPAGEDDLTKGLDSSESEPRSLVAVLLSFAGSLGSGRGMDDGMARVGTGSGVVCCGLGAGQFRGLSDVCCVGGGSGGSRDGDRDGSRGSDRDDKGVVRGTGGVIPVGAAVLVTIAGVGVVCFSGGKCPFRRETSSSAIEL